MKALGETNARKGYANLLGGLCDNDPFIQSAAIGALAQPVFQEDVLKDIENKDPRIRLGALLALRRAGYKEPTSILGRLLADPDEKVRLMALVWIGEEKLAPLADQLPAALSAGKVSPTLFRTYSTTADVLAKAKSPTGGKPFTQTPPLNTNVQTLVMKMAVGRDHVAAIELLSKGDHEPTLQLRLEAVRALAESGNSKANEILTRTALSTKNPSVLRAEAILALASEPADVLTRLIALLDDPDATIQIETARAFRQATSDLRILTALQKKLQAAQDDRRQALLAEQLQFALHAARAESGGSIGQPVSDDEWRKALAAGGDVASGRRVFFHPAVGCAKCHRVEDHGGSIGTDLSTIARSSDREKLMQSLLHPSREIAPQWVQHSVETRDQQSYTGLLAGRAADDSITLITADGKGILIPAQKIVSSHSSTVSLMPEGLEKAMTTQDFRDLLAFLSSLQ
jgi:hypothetical protein